MKYWLFYLLFLPCLCHSAVLSPKADSFTTSLPMARTSVSVPLVVLPPPTNVVNVPLAWNPSPGAVLYKIYYGIASKIYTNFVTSVTTNISVTVPDSSDYYFAATAVDGLGRESNYSNEVSTLGPQNRIIKFFVETSQSLTGAWTFYTNIWTATNPPGNKLFRLRGSVEYFY